MLKIRETFPENNFNMVHVQGKCGVFLESCPNVLWRAHMNAKDFT